MSSFLSVHTPLSPAFDALASLVIETWTDGIVGLKPSQVIDVCGDDDNALIINKEHVQFVLIDDGEWRCGAEFYCECAHPHEMSPKDVTNDQWDLLTHAIACYFKVNHPEQWRK